MGAWRTAFAAARARRPSAPASAARRTRSSLRRRSSEIAPAARRTFRSALRLACSSATTMRAWSSTARFSSSVMRSSRDGNRAMLRSPSRSSRVRRPAARAASTSAQRGPFVAMAPVSRHASRRSQSWRPIVRSPTIVDSRPAPSRSMNCSVASRVVVFASGRNVAALASRRARSRASRFAARIASFSRCAAVSSSVASRRVGAGAAAGARTCSRLPARSSPSRSATRSPPPRRSSRRPAKAAASASTAPPGRSSTAGSGARGA